MIQKENQPTFYADALTKKEYDISKDAMNDLEGIEWCEKLLHKAKMQL